MMDQLLGITFDGKTASIPRQNLSPEDLEKLFNKTENDLYLEVIKGLLWENIWPTSSSEIEIPENITTALLIIIPNDIHITRPCGRNEDKTCQSECIYSMFFVFITTIKYVTVQNELKGYGTRTVSSFKGQSSSFLGSRKRTKNELPNYEFICSVT